MVGTYLAALGRNPNFLQRDVKILIDGCSFGEGESGDWVINYIGQNMLKGRGGYIGASTVKNTSPTLSLIFSSNIFLYPFKGETWQMANGRLKVKRYDMNGKQIGSQTLDKKGIPD